MIFCISIYSNNIFRNKLGVVYVKLLYLTEIFVILLLLITHICLLDVSDEDIVLFRITGNVLDRDKAVRHFMNRCEDDVYFGTPATVYTATEK